MNGGRIIRANQQAHSVVALRAGYMQHAAQHGPAIAAALAIGQHAQAREGAGLAGRGKDVAGFRALLGQDQAGAGDDAVRVAQHIQTAEIQILPHLDGAGIVCVPGGLGLIGAKTIQAQQGQRVLPLRAGKLHHKAYTSTVSHYNRISPK